MGGAADVNEIVAALQQQYPSAQIEIDGAQTFGQAAAAPTEDDRVAPLERLAKLKGSGASHVSLIGPLGMLSRRDPWWPNAHCPALGHRSMAARIW